MNLRFTPILAVALYATTHVAVTAADFSAVSIPGLPGLDSSSIAWGDYDNDGRLDFLVTGATNNSGTGGTTQLWRNTGSGFTNVNLAGVPEVVFGSASWADYDNDGRLDFLLTGTTNGILTGTISQLWRNTGTGFSNVTDTAAPGLPGVNQGSIAWGDFDNNGTLDLIIVGRSPGGRVAQLWRNTAHVFTNATSAMAPGLTAIDIAFAAAGDYDNDGWLDLIIAGETSTGRVTQIFHNTGTELVEVTSAVASGLPGVAFASAAWGDYDNDGLLDLVLTGESATGRVAQVWHNNGSSLSNATASLMPGLVGLRYGSTAWADYDNDGRLDLLLTGNPAAGTFATQIWRNTGSGFTNAEEPIPGTYSTSGPNAAWADFDNDGRVDVLVTGTSLGGGIAELWRNGSAITNNAPPAPSNLTSSSSNGVLLLHWAAVIDDQSGTNVTYNLRVGTAPGAGDVVGPEADPASGFRRVPALGNVQLGTDAMLNLPDGTYYWSVQAVDGALAGGAFAPAQTLQLPLPAVPPVLKIAPAGPSVLISWEPATPGWFLQEASTLPTGWTNSPSGSMNPVTIQRVEAKKFYRLHAP